MQTVGGVDKAASFGYREKGFGEVYVHDFLTLGDLSDSSILNTQKNCLPLCNATLRLQLAEKNSAFTLEVAQMKKKAESKPKTASKPAEKSTEKSGGAKKGGKK
jgi:hypothetical protein